MIDPKELRLGNLVWDNDWEKPLPVTIISGEYFGNSDPIPITEEWLVKSGRWVDMEYGGGRISGLFGDGVNSGFLLEYEEDVWIFEIGYDSYYGEDIPLKYLHELQNLYYALTKEEVAFNL